jgi:hypothetical protein
VPAGFTAGLNGKDTPDYPLGATFTGRAWSEPTPWLSSVGHDDRVLCDSPLEGRGFEPLVPLVRSGPVSRQLAARKV